MRAGLFAVRALPPAFTIKIMTDTTMLTRPLRDEELRLEAESRAVGGPLQFVRFCRGCNQTMPPTGYDDVQSCGNCEQPFPGAPYTWSITEHPELKTVLTLRRGDYLYSRPTPAAWPDGTVSEGLVTAIWIKAANTIFYSDSPGMCTQCQVEPKIGETEIGDWAVYQHHCRSCNEKMIERQKVREDRTRLSTPGRLPRTLA